MSPLTKGGTYFSHIVTRTDSLTFSILGLISRAIAQSGTSLTAWGQPPHKGVAPKHAAKLAKVFDCETPNDWQKTIDCLRNVPAENITSATYNFFKWDRDPVVPFPPGKLNWKCVYLTFLVMTARFAHFRCFVHWVCYFFKSCRTGFAWSIYYKASTQI